MTLFIVVKAEHDSGADKYDNHPVEAYTEYDLAHERCVELERAVSRYVFDYYFISTIELIK